MAIAILVLLFAARDLKKQHRVIHDTVCLKPEVLPEFHKPQRDTIPNYCNNPGNITAGYNKYDTLAVGYINTGSHKFLVFPDEQTGWKALEMRIKQSGRQTLREFLIDYGGLSYLPALCHGLGGKPWDRVSDHLKNIEHFKSLMGAYEGWTHGRNVWRK